MASLPSQDTPTGATDSPPGRVGDRPAPWRARSRWMVHLGLLATAAGAIVTLQYLHVRIAIHTDVGLAFVGLVLIHLLQRRHTIARWATQLVGRRPRTHGVMRRVSSDTILAVLTVNVLISGIVDWGRGQPTHLPLLPGPLARWHLVSGLALVVYLVVHVARRRNRLRRSVIR